MALKERDSSKKGKEQGLVGDKGRAQGHLQAGGTARSQDRKIAHLYPSPLPIL